MTATGLSSCADRVAAPLRELLDELHELAQHAAPKFDQGKPTQHDVAALRPLICAALARHPGLDGIGLVLAPGALADADLHLEWWARTADGGERQLLLDLDPASEDFYDYPAREWFHAPAEGAQLGISGPYVDYRGADDYVFTVAVPVHAGGHFVGIAGADYPLQTLEDELAPTLRARGPGVVLVNREQRVIAGGSARWRPGERLRPPEISAQELMAADRVPVPPDELGWWLIDLA